jgi:hypothetical protein
MAYGNVPAESPGNVAQSSRYNQLVTNVDDLDTRLDIVEARTIDTSGAVGIGNQRLSDRLGAGVTNVATADARFGAGVGTGSNVTTGSAASQLTDLRSRATALEGTVNNGSTGVAALNTALGAANTKYGANSITKYAIPTSVTLNTSTPNTFWSQSISIPTSVNNVGIVAFMDIELGGTLTSISVSVPNNILVVELLVDGVANAQQLLFCTTVPLRGTMGQSWGYVNVSSGSHTFALRATIVNTTGTVPTYKIYTPHSGAEVTIINK